MHKSTGGSREEKTQTQTQTQTRSNTTTFGINDGAEFWSAFTLATNKHIDRIVFGSNAVWNAYSRSHGKVLLVDLSSGRNDDREMRHCVSLVARDETGSDLVYLAFAYLRNNSPEDFRWLFEMVKAQYRNYSVPLPLTIFSSEMKECYETIYLVFPHSHMQLWLREINRDFVATCKSRVVKDTDRDLHNAIDESTLTRDETIWLEILLAWAQILESESRKEFKDRWKEFQAKYKQKFPLVVSYLKYQWVKPHKRILTGLWTRDGINQAFDENAYMEGATEFLREAAGCHNLADALEAIQTAYRAGYVSKAVNLGGYGREEVEEVDCLDTRVVALLQGREEVDGVDGEEEGEEAGSKSEDEEEDDSQSEEGEEGNESEEEGNESVEEQDFEAESEAEAAPTPKTTKLNGSTPKGAIEYGRGLLTRERQGAITRYAEDGDDGEDDEEEDSGKGSEQEEEEDSGEEESQDDEEQNQESEEEPSSEDIVAVAKFPSIEAETPRRNPLREAELSARVESEVPADTSTPTRTRRTRAASARHSLEGRPSHTPQKTPTDSPARARTRKASTPTVKRAEQKSEEEEEAGPRARTRRASRAAAAGISPSQSVSPSQSCSPKLMRENAALGEAAPKGVRSTRSSLRTTTATVVEAPVTRTTTPSNKRPRSRPLRSPRNSETPTPTPPKQPRGRSSKKISSVDKLVEQKTTPKSTPTKETVSKVSETPVSISKTTHKRAIKVTPRATPKTRKRAADNDENNESKNVHNSDKADNDEKRSDKNKNDENDENADSGSARKNKKRKSDVAATNGESAKDGSKNDSKDGNGSQRKKKKPRLSLGQRIRNFFPV